MPRREPQHMHSFIPLPQQSTPHWGPMPSSPSPRSSRSNPDPRLTHHRHHAVSFVLSFLATMQGVNEQANQLGSRLCIRVKTRAWGRAEEERGPKSWPQRGCRYIVPRRRFSASGRAVWSVPLHLTRRWTARAQARRIGSEGHRHQQLDGWGRAPVPSRGREDWP